MYLPCWNSIGYVLTCLLLRVVERLLDLFETGNAAGTLPGAWTPTLPQAGGWGDRASGDFTAFAFAFVINQRLWLHGDVRTE